MRRDLIKYSENSTKEKKVAFRAWSQRLGKEIKLENRGDVANLNICFN